MKNIEHPIKIILKAFAIVIIASIIIFAIPSIVTNFGVAEWYLTITAGVLTSLSMLVQIYTNSNKLSAKMRVKSTY